MVLGGGHKKENITYKHGALQTSEHITGEEWRSLKWPPPAGYWHRETRTHTEAFSTKIHTLWFVPAFVCIQITGPSVRGESKCTKSCSMQMTEVDAFFDAHCSINRTSKESVVGRECLAVPSKHNSVCKHGLSMNDVRAFPVIWFRTYANTHSYAHISKSMCTVSETWLTQSVVVSF